MKTPAILVINAGSSSIKFSIFSAAVTPGPGDLVCGGKISGIGVQARLDAKAADGTVMAEERFPEDSAYDDLLARLLDWIETHLDGLDLRRFDLAVPEIAVEKLFAPAARAAEPVVPMVRVVGAPHVGRAAVRRGPLFRRRFEGAGELLITFLIVVRQQPPQHLLTIVAVVACVEIKLQTPHAIDATLSP